MTRDISVLLVEDNEAESRQVEFLLRNSTAKNFEVTTARFLNTAYQVLASRQFDIVLLDLSLPDSPVGIHTLSEFMQRCPGAPVIVLTGSDDIQLAEQAASLGAQDYIVKSELRGHLLERAIAQGIQRRRNDEVRRRLTFASLNNIAERGDHEDARVTMARPHISALLAYFDDLAVYLRDNAPAHYEAMRSLELSRGLRTVIKELRGILSLEKSESHRTIDRARSEVVKARDSEPYYAPPTDVSAAKEDILTVLERYAR